MKRILVVEDDFALAKSLREALCMQEYRVEIANCFEIAERMFYQRTFDFVILDIQLPDGNGIELCKEIRKHSQVPVLFLTANDNEDMLVNGLNSGGDDYMTKPFRIKELYARIQALLRRSRVLQDEIKLGELVVHVKRREVFVNQKQIILSSIDFEILKLILIHKEQVLTRRQLLEAIDQEESFVEDNTLSVHVKRLRDKLGTYKGISYIETVRGIGYRINREVLYEDK